MHNYFMQVNECTRIVFVMQKEYIHVYPKRLKGKNFVAHPTWKMT